MKNENSSFSCGCILLVLIFNILIGGWSVNYLLAFFLEKDIPFFADALIGLFTAEISVPLAIIVWLLQQFGVV